MNFNIPKMPDFQPTKPTIDPKPFQAVHRQAHRTNFDSLKLLTRFGGLSAENRTKAEELAKQMYSNHELTNADIAWCRDNYIAWE